MAPGGDILSTLPGNSTGKMSGTSMAAPYATALAALVLSVNPSLTNSDVCRIIEQTAQKVVDIHILQFLEDLMVHIIMKWDMA